MNLFCGNLEELFKKYQVYNVPTMGMDDFMVVSGMPNVVGKGKKQWTQKCLIQNIQGTSMSLRLLAWRLIFLQDLWSYKSRIDQTWNSMCAWDSTGKYSDTNDKNIWHEWENITLSLVQRPGGRRGGGLQAAELLHHVQDARRGQEDREPRRGHEDPHQRGQKLWLRNF